MEDKKEMQQRNEEWYAKMNQQFEEDSKIRDYNDPEMDKWFYKMLDEEIRKGRSRKIAKITGIAAGIVLCASVALSGFTQVVYGESLFDIIKNSIEAGKFTISAFSQVDVSEFENYDTITVCYEADSIEELLEQIINDDQVEISELFYLQGLPSEYTQWTAKYNTKFKKITISSKHKENHLYIYEELSYENVVSGTVTEAEVASTVFNEKLQMDINIIAQMDNIKVQGYYFEVFYNNMRLLIEGDGTLEEFETIAKNIYLSEGN